ncbi:hypothetical protein C2E21_0018 [Chlorella sorokiniana]|uniref:Uncharacterized protein n=1 Tax=Chlorella sorokiniana TaxID=3076 RepID=A0A2P6U3M3_CHLSO|nr:hypothetical protein C2E21_0018 [Chlorella sorokiniana]|eukprot:PRW60910.1 hypothetical protein C2E21_0018 [Chlorella sorokiniana]
MRMHEQLLTAAGDLHRKPCPTSTPALAAATALLGTLALWSLACAPPGLHNLLLLCIARIAVLLCIGAATCRALYHRRAPHSPPAGASPRSSFVQAAVCLQLVWLAAEVLLGSALLLSRPALNGAPLAGTEAASESGPLAALLSLLPLALAAAMSGCFLFLSRLASGRRQRSQNSCASDSACCPLERGMSRPLQPRDSSATLCSCGSRGALGPTCSLHSVEVMCSPASSDDGTRSCSSCSSGASAAFYQRAAASYATSYGSSGSAGYLSTGAPSPTGHLASPGVEEQAHHAAAIQAACEIVLQEHQLDTNEWVLFVHKRLPAIKTRPEDKHSERPGLLRELISNSFSFNKDAAAQVQAQVVAAVAAGGGSAASAASLSFCTEG